MIDTNGLPQSVEEFFEYGIGIYYTESEYQMKPHEVVWDFLEHIDDSGIDIFRDKGDGISITHPDYDKRYSIQCRSDDQYEFEIEVTKYQTPEEIKLEKRQKVIKKILNDN